MDTRYILPVALAIVFIVGLVFVALSIRWHNLTGRPSDVAGTKNIDTVIDAMGVIPASKRETFANAPVGCPSDRVMCDYMVAASIASAETVERASTTTALFRPLATHRSALAHEKTSASALLLVRLFRFLHRIAERHSGFFNRHHVLHPRRHLAFALAARERRRRKSSSSTGCGFERRHCLFI